MQKSDMPEVTPEMGAAALQLFTAVRKSGAQVLLWAVLAAASASPVVLPQINATRAEGGSTYLVPADFHIIGPERAEVGSLIRLSVHDQHPTDVCWFTVGDSQTYGTNGDEVILTASEEGLVTVTVAMIRRGNLYLTTKEIVIGPGTAPEPAVTPVVPVVVPEVLPEPEVVVEPVKALDAVGKKIVKMAKEVDLDATTAAEVAANLRVAVNTMGDKNPRALLMETVRLNKEIELPGDAEDGIKVLLQTMAENGDLASMTQHVEVWESMAAGFEKYSQGN